jgi:hypothetical protein
MVSPECAAAAAEFPVLIPGGDEFEVDTSRSSLAGETDGTSLIYSAFVYDVSTNQEIRLIQSRSELIRPSAAAYSRTIGGRSVRMWIEGETRYAQLATEQSMLNVRGNGASEEDMVRLIDALESTAAASAEDCGL